MMASEHSNIFYLFFQYDSIWLELEPFDPWMIWVRAKSPQSASWVESSLDSRQLHSTHLICLFRTWTDFCLTNSTQQRLTSPKVR